MEDNLSEEELEKLRLENEIRKMKLELEQGAKFYENPEMSTLSPEIENEFLNYIEQFEKMNADSPKISIFEKIGSPDCKKVAELQKNEIEPALDHLMETLNEHGIQLSTIHDVEDAELYRFITEELFPHEIYDMSMMKGMMTHFIYEEFHPDEIKDITKCIEDFFDKLFDLQDEEDYFKHHLSDGDTVNKWLFEFRASYVEFNLHALHIRSIQVHDDEEMEAEATFEIDFDAYTDGRTEKHTYIGLAHASLIYTGGWSIRILTLPKAI